ncbi:hypothetical protein [Novipirellula rosea]|uniref:hypothetical protein n=1 Tax=Novipirellula rosea TaxID=1031540 RepID=UPI0031F0578D
MHPSVAGEGVDAPTLVAADLGIRSGASHGFVVIKPALSPKTANLTAVMLY